MINSNIEFIEYSIQYADENNNNKLIHDIIKNIIKYYINYHNNKDLNYVISNLLNTLIEKYYNIIDENTYYSLADIYDFDETLVKNIFKFLLTKEGYPEIVFDIINENIILSVILAEITMSDPDYHVYITKYLEIYLDNIEQNRSEGDYDFDIPFIYEENEINYYLAKILMEKMNLTNTDSVKMSLKRDIISHLIKAGDYADAALLRTRLSQVYYLNEDIGQNPQFPIDNNIDTILNLLEYINKIKNE